MSRLGVLSGITLALVLAVPQVSLAYFPPVIGGTAETPPDPFPVNNLGGLGEPEANEPDKLPTVATPEPATIVTALMGLAVAAGVGYRQRRQQQPMN